MRIDLTCPVEIWYFTKPTEQSPACVLRLYNMVDKAAVSVQLCLMCRGAGGEQTARHVERVQGIDAPRRRAFDISVDAPEAVNAFSMDAYIEKVWFEDNTVWRRGSTELAEYNPVPPLKDGRLEVLRELAGPDAGAFPSDQGAVWVCVCGRPNAASEDKCRRCLRDKHTVFLKLNEASIESILFERESKREEEQKRLREEQKRLQAEKDAAARKKRRRKKRVWTAIISAVVLIGLTYLTYHHGIPYYRYYTATQALEGGRYDAAKETFLSLTDYRDSAEMAKECDYLSATASLNGGTYTSLRVAQDGFGALGDYKDSATMAKEARYVRAEKLLAASEFDQAAALYEEIKGYKDASDKALLAAYRRAGALLDAGQYAQAREKYLALGAYQQSQALAQECCMRPAAAALQNGDPLTAIEYYEQITDYKDAARQLQIAYYDAGDLYYGQQLFDDAAKYFLLAGDYANAYRRATQCLYDPAVLTMENGDYLKAAEMFSQIASFQDSRELMGECYYRLGEELMQARDYEGAAKYFDRAPLYEKAVEARKECAYIPATEKMAGGDETGALELFLTIPDYKDADEYIKQLRYRRAISALAENDLDDAIEQLEALGDYNGSDGTLIEAKVKKAEGMTDDGQYSDALALLSTLGDDERAANAAKRARYLLAQRYKTQGEYALAAIEYALLTGYEDADALYRECVYHQAKAAVEIGDLSGATALLEPIRDDSAAQELYNECAYKTAELARDSGALHVASRLFATLGGYRDSITQAARCADSYFGQAREQAVQKANAGDFAAAADILGALDLSFLPTQYGDIPELYKEACYQAGNKLYDEGKPFAALYYYNQVRDYKDVTEKRLARSVYRLIGHWRTEKGYEMIFREDGTCTIDGQNHYFYATVYAVYLGTTPEERTYVYNIKSLYDNAMTLYHESNKVYYRMTRVKGD